YTVPLTEAFLLENPFLVLDTAFFTEQFKQQLLAGIDNIEEQLDGTLINSENFQALNLLQEKYKGEVKCIYTDPPYNTGNDDFVYKDNFQQSSWLTMMNDRLLIAKSFVKQEGTLSISIDLKEVDKTISLLDSVYGESNRKNAITVKRGSVTGAKVINPGV
ncbi:site-specific DNA-methyltransferase, partial [bacterium]|nr:site-specific DNA-methyltransferase [bacterium]